MNEQQLNNTASKIKKVLKYTYMYGPSRTFIKVKGHQHMKKEYKTIPKNALKNDKKSVGIVGCGNHAFTDIAYFLRKNSGNILLLTRWLYYYQCPS